MVVPLILRCRQDTPVLAPVDAQVFSSCTPGNNHRAIKFKASSGQEFSILHVQASSSAVQTGRRYARGEQIGVVAADTPSGNNCANSTGPHLHFGLPSVPFTVDGYTFRAGETLRGSINSTNSGTDSPRSTTAFSGNVSSRLSVSSNSVDLRVSASNLSGKKVYVQLWRPAHAGYPDRVWNTSVTASGNNAVFLDLDGPGGTFAGVPYYTVASLSPLGANEAKRQRSSCFADTNSTQLCDRKQR